jgi:hypothetical protein
VPRPSMVFVKLIKKPRWRCCKLGICLIAEGSGVAGEGACMVFGTRTFWPGTRAGVPWASKGKVGAPSGDCCGCCCCWRCWCWCCCCWRCCCSWPCANVAGIPPKNDVAELVPLAGPAESGDGGTPCRCCCCWRERPAALRRCICFAMDESMLSCLPSPPANGTLNAAGGNAVGACGPNWPFCALGLAKTTRVSALSCNNDDDGSGVLTSLEVQSNHHHHHRVQHRLAWHTHTVSSLVCNYYRYRSNHKYRDRFLFA